MALGSMGILLLHHTVGGKWGAMVTLFAACARRAAEPFNLQLAIHLSRSHIVKSAGTPYPWARPEAAHSATLQAKAAYLNAPFFLIRTVFYFLVWTFYARSASANGRPSRIRPARNT